MKPISYARDRFPPDVIQHAVWLYLRFTLSYHDVEDLLAERGLEVSNKSIRRWVLKFGSAIARNLRSARPKPHDRWYLDEMAVSIGGQRISMWRAVDRQLPFTIDWNQCARSRGLRTNGAKSFNCGPFARPVKVQ